MGTDHALGHLPQQSPSSGQEGAGSQQEQPGAPAPPGWEGKQGEGAGGSGEAAQLWGRGGRAGEGMMLLPDKTFLWVGDRYSPLKTFSEMVLSDT